MMVVKLAAQMGMIMLVVQMVMVLVKLAAQIGMIVLVIQMVMVAVQMGMIVEAKRQMKVLRGLGMTTRTA